MCQGDIEILNGFFISALPNEKLPASTMETGSFSFNVLFYANGLSMASKSF